VLFHAISELTYVLFFVRNCLRKYAFVFNCRISVTDTPVRLSVLLQTICATLSSPTHLMKFYVINKYYVGTTLVNLLGSRSILQ